ncbi:hypothetical protein PybrP1_005470, partial [[Pythium] brassicae (nom. inval.)]
MAEDADLPSVAFAVLENDTPVPVFPAQAQQIAQAAAVAKRSSLAPGSALTPAPSSPQPSMNDTLLPDGSLDMRGLMIALWKNRKNGAFTAELCARLPYLTINTATLDQVEFYLPQLAHMVVHLEKELPMAAMEQFVLLLSQSSVHFALQFFWIIFAALDENRPKRGGSPRTFARCAQLLLALEQCFVYGSPAAKQASELLTRNSISRDEMDQIVLADRRFFAAQSSLEICYEGGGAGPSGADKSAAGGQANTVGGSLGSAGGGSAGLSAGEGGWLFKKGGGTSKMGRRNWKLRWCRVENRILLVFTRPSDSNPRTAFPLVRAEIRVVANKKHPFYFELLHELSETRMQFAAQSQEELVAWIALLQKHAAAPEPPAAGGASTSPGKVSTGRTLARMSFAMRSFILDSSSGAASHPPSSPAPATEEGVSEEATTGPSPAFIEPFSARIDSSSVATGSGSPERRDRAQTVSSIFSSAAQLAGTRSVTETGEASSSASQSECFQLPALTTSSLLPEQQVRYEFFSGMINFVKAITDVSESLRRVEPAKRKALLRPRLETLKIPPLAYLPLCKSTDERAPCMIYFETEENENGDDVSKALFTQLYATSDDAIDASERDASGGSDTLDDEEVEDITALDSTDEILKYLADSPPKPKAIPPPQPLPTAHATATTPESEMPTLSPFLRRLLASPERKQKLERIFGELTLSAVERLRPPSGAVGAFASRSRWRLCCVMAKSFDDLRQEVLVMQLISYFRQIFEAENLALWLQPYRILSTGASTGLLEVVRNTTSLDGLKKTPGFKNLRAHFQDVYGSDSDGNCSGELLKQAELNFIHSLGGALAVRRHAETIYTLVE